MASFNKVILAGNLTRDPELRYTPKGTAVAQFTLAISHKWKTESGEAKEDVSFIDIEAFGRQGEVVAQYMRKGRPFLVEGRLKQDTWEDKTTQQKRSKLKVILEGFSFIDSKGTDAGPAPASAEAPRRSAPPPPAARAPEPSEPADAAGPEEDDVPF